MIPEVEIDMAPSDQKIQQNNGQTSQLYKMFAGEYDIIEIFQLITVVLLTVVFLILHKVIISKEK